MTVLAQICFWLGLVLIAVGSFMYHDDRPGHDGVGKVEQAVGFIGIAVKTVIDTASREAARAACWEPTDPSILHPEYRSYQEIQECLRAADAGPNWWSALLKDAGENFLFGGLAFGVGWLAARLTSRPGPPGT
jgi:hypothetical protein